MTRLNPRLLSVLAGSALAYSAAAQSAFTDLGVLPGGQQSTALAVSGDGGTAVGRADGDAFRWNRQTGMSNLGSIGGVAAAAGASQDGSVIVGQSGTLAWRWSGGVMVNLGTLPNLTSLSNATGVSADGSVVSGWCESASTGVFHPFRWTSAGGMADLGFLSGGAENSTANAVSGNGLVVVGRATPTMSLAVAHATRWEGGVLQDLGIVPGRPGSIAYATNYNGSVVVGTSYDSNNYVNAMRWTSTGGMQNLGVLPGAFQSIAWGVSGDGAVVVGACIFDPNHNSRRPFIWTQANGMQDLSALMTSMGISTNGLVLSGAYGVNQDGTVIVGASGEDGNSAVHAWALDLHGDSDGDGLRDDWEIYGIPYTDAGGNPQRYILPGADPAHKDLYVEMDSMSGMSFRTDALAMVQQAFANAPLTNPDGTGGVRLHVVPDETDLAHVDVWETNGCWPLDFDEFRDTYFGTPAEQSDPRGPNLLLAKAMAYRYCIIADQSNPGLGGCGGRPGDDFVIYLGGVGDDPTDQAAVFMHEFGHNLGLAHGGGDSVNGKPNYPSVMNYVLAYKGPWNQSFWRLDYSHVGPPGLANLNENSLDETAGIGSFAGFYAGFSMPFGVTVDQGGSSARVVRYVRLNGTPTDFGDTLGTGTQDGMFTAGVVQDLNYLVVPPAGIHLPTQPSPGEILTAYDDWGHVVLATLASRGPGAPLPEFPTDELQIEARDWINQNFPPLIQTCYANCDGSTTAPILNVLDFACFLNRYAAGDTYANCDNSTSPPIVNVLDFACFLNKFAAGCS